MITIKVKKNRTSWSCDSCEGDDFNDEIKITTTRGNLLVITLCRTCQDFLTKELTK